MAVLEIGRTQLHDPVTRIFLCGRLRYVGVVPQVRISMLAIQGISKVYRLFDKPFDRLKQLAPFVSMKPKEFWALRDITFEVGKGEIVSLIGPNGCGKSTLLQIVSGILQPTCGRVVTRGRLAALLDR